MMASADGPIRTFPLRGIKDTPPYLLCSPRTTTGVSPDGEIRGVQTETASQVR
jgi:hypothetical protein